MLVEDMQPSFNFSYQKRTPLSIAYTPCLRLPKLAACFHNGEAKKKKNKMLKKNLKIINVRFFCIGTTMMATRV